MKSVLLLSLLVLVAGCLGSASPVGVKEIRNIQEGEGAALFTHVAHLTTASVEGTAVIIEANLGSYESRDVEDYSCSDCYELYMGPLRKFNLSDVEFRLIVPEGLEVVEGQTTWTGDLNAGETHNERITIRPTRHGVWELRSTMAMDWKDIGHSAEGQVLPRYTDRDSFYVLYDGEQILLSADGVWCSEGTYFDAARLTCTTAPDCPEGYRYINGTATCAAMGQQINDDTEDIDVGREDPNAVSPQPSS